MTLQDRIDELAAQERDWMEQGHPVLIVSNTVAWWNERGIHTAADLDLHFAGDPHETSSDRAYHARLDYEAWLDEHEPEPLTDAEYEAQALAEAVRLDAAAFNPVFAETRESRLYAHYQAGW